MLRCRGALLPPPVVGRQHRTLFAASPVALKPKHTRVVELDKLPEVESRHYGSLSLPAAARRRSAPAPTPTPTPTPTPPPAAAAEAATRAAAKAPSAPPQQPPPEQRPRQQEAAVEADTPVPSTATAAIHPDRVAVAIHPDRVAAAAQRRPRPRADESHLLVVKQESLLSRHFPDLPEGLSPDHVLLLMDMRRTWISMKGSSHARDLYPFPLEELLAHMSGGDGVEPSAVFSVMLDVVTAGPETVELVEEMRSRGAFYRELLPRPWRPGMPERYGQRRSRHAVAVMHDSTVSQLEDIVAGGRPAKLYRIFFFNALYAVILKVRGMAYALHEREESSVLAWTVECDHLLVRLLARNLPREARDIMLGYTDDPYDVRIQKTLNAETWNALLQGMATKSKYAIVDYDNDRWDASIEKVAKLVRSRNILLNHVSVSYLVERWHDVDRHKAVIAIATRATSRDANGARVVFSGETWAHVIKSLALATTPQAGMDLGEALKARVLQEYEGRYAAPDDFLARAGSRYVDARLPLFPELKRGWLHHALLPLKFQTHLFHTLMEVATLLPDTGVAMAKLLSLANEFKFRAVPQMEALQVLEARARSEDAVPMLPPSDDEPPEAAVEPEQPSEEDATAAAVGGDKERNEAYHGYFRYMSITSVQHPWTVYFKDVTLAGCIVTLCLSHNTENGAALVFKLLRDGFTLSAKTITLVATRVEKHCRKLKFQERKPDKAELLAKAMLLELTTAVSEMTRRYATRWGDAKDGRAKRVRGAFMTPHVLDAMKTAQRDLDRALFRLSLSTQDFSSCLTAFSKYAEDATNPNLRIRWIEAGDLLRMLTVCADHGRWKTAEALFAQYTSYSAPHRGLDTEQSRVRDTETSTSWYLMVNQLLRAHAKTPISASELRFERFMELSLQACLRGSVLDFAIVKEVWCPPPPPPGFYRTERRVRRRRYPNTVIPLNFLPPPDFTHHTHMHSPSVCWPTKQRLGGAVTH